MLESLLADFRQGNRRAMARLLSLLMRGEQVQAILSGLGAPSEQTRVIALTGSAGVGKSTLVGKLIEAARKDDQTVAVLACDPQSPVSGGALLGDRFRMGAAPDPGVFIRSISTPGGKGAITDHLPEMIQLLKVYGFNLILIETVGAGQGDTHVKQVADGMVLMLQPETGDDLQWEKAGVMEVADIITVHKADLPGAENLEAQIRTTLSLSDHPMPEIVRVSSRKGTGITELWQAIGNIPLRDARIGTAAAFLQVLQAETAKRFADLESKKELRDLISGWERGVVPLRQAVDECLSLLMEL